MGSWYKQNRFLKKRKQFSHLDEMGLTVENWGNYSINYALWKILSECRVSETCFRRDILVSGYLLAYYCKDTKLAVDVEYTENSRRHKEESACDRALFKVGVKMLRFPKAQILNSSDQVKNIVLEVLSERVNN